MSRRRFIKRTGGATLTTLSLWSLGNQMVKAENFGISSYDPLVLVCTGTPEDCDDYLPSVTKNCIAEEIEGDPPVEPRKYVTNGDVIEPYQSLGVSASFTGPQKGNWSYTTFHIKVDALFALGGQGVSEFPTDFVSRTVSFDEETVEYFPPLNSSSLPQPSPVDGRNLHTLLELNEGNVAAAHAFWGEGQKYISSKSAWYEISDVTALLSGPIPGGIPGGAVAITFGWTFKVMSLSEAIKFEASVNN